MPSNRKDTTVPERILRRFWRDHDFSEPGIRSSDGRKLTVISKGEQNSDAGPDFKCALIRIGGIMYRGDVEIHRRNRDWFDHRHCFDPKYNSVVLHVVQRNEDDSKSPVTESGRIVPVLALTDMPGFGSFLKHAKSTQHKTPKDIKNIECPSRRYKIKPHILRKRLEKLAAGRLELKLKRCEERLREIASEKSMTAGEPHPRYGIIPFGIDPAELPTPAGILPESVLSDKRIWNQLLYEGFMESIGYSKNQETLLRLARSVTLDFLSRHTTGNGLNDRIRIESILFFAAGLIPDSPCGCDAETSKYIGLLGKKWKEIKPSYRGRIFVKSDWQFFRLRPENFPTVRLASAAYLAGKFINNEIFGSVTGILSEEKPPRRSRHSALAGIFESPAEGYWKDRYTFGGKKQKKRRRLIGRRRAYEIVVNAVIPVTLLYAKISGDAGMRRRILSFYRTFPSPGKNSITEMIERRVIKRKFRLNSAVLQQGAIQLYRFYCEPGKCKKCGMGY